MGFDIDVIEAVVTNYENVLPEQAMDLLQKTKRDKWKHKFVPQKQDESKCGICKEEKEPHIPEIPSTHSVPRPISSRARAVRELSQTSCCGICLESVDEENFYSLACGHNFCYYCVKDYLRLEIEEGRVGRLVCPELKCVCEFTEFTLRLLLTDYLLAKYRRFRRNWEVSTNPCEMWCISPNCDNVLPIFESTPQVYCDKCRVEFCAKCRVAWHEEKTCQEYFDTSYEEWRKGKNVQDCPNPNCRARIEKESGCDHITCVVCEFEWCWLCRQSYSALHSLSFNPFGCPGSRKPWYKLWARRLFLLIFLPISKYYSVLPVMFGCWLSNSANKQLGWRGWGRAPLSILMVLVFVLGCGLGVLLMVVCALPALGLSSYELAKSMCVRCRGLLARF